MHSDWVNGVCGDGQVISYLVNLYTARSQLISVIREVINEIHQRSVSINSVITAIFCTDRLIATWRCG